MVRDTSIGGEVGFQPRRGDGCSRQQLLLVPTNIGENHMTILEPRVEVRGVSDTLVHST